MLESEVNITKDGFNIQTDVNTFKSYYKRLGWKLVGRAPVLTGFDKVQSRNGRITELSENRISELNIQQQSLF